MHIYCLTRWLFSAKIKIKIPDLQNIRRSVSKRELQTITFYLVAHKKEEGTYHHNEKCLDSSAPGRACLSSSFLNKGQSVPDRSKPAHRKPLVKCLLTLSDQCRDRKIIEWERLEISEKIRDTKQIFHAKWAR